MRYIAFVFALTGCVTAPSKQAQTIQLADMQSVAGCQFVTSVQGSSVLGGLWASDGIKNARVEALEQAATAGATHLVLTSSSMSHSVQAVVGNAYRCQ